MRSRRGPAERDEGAGGDGGADAAAVWRMVCDLVLDNERRREVADALGMSFGRVRALRRIAARPMPMGELAGVLGVDAPYATVIVDELERQGLVERRAHPTDRRARVVVATRRGNAAARRAEAILGTPPVQLSELGGTDLRELARILGRMQGTDTAGRGQRPTPSGHDGGVKGEPR